MAELTLEGLAKQMTEQAEAHTKELEALKTKQEESDKTIAELQAANTKLASALGKVKAGAAAAQPEDGAKPEKLKTPEGKHDFDGGKIVFKHGKMNVGGKVIPSAVIAENMDVYASYLRKLITNKSPLIEFAAAKEKKEK